jgi:glycosyltransferase involved in cell wall biosynthesis
MKMLILFAPNVYVGGGFVLLQDLLSSVQLETKLIAILDERAKPKLNLPQKIKVIWAQHSLRGRIIAEYSLSKLSKQNETTIFCFHGLPPLFCINHLNIIVFLQNRLYFGDISFSSYNIRIAVRIFIERTLFRLLQHKVSQFIVQTHTMAKAVAHHIKYGNNKSYKILNYPFAQPLAEATITNTDKLWDFIYVADGLAHKNHKGLIQAWVELAKTGLRPSLALTLPERDHQLIEELEHLKTQYDLDFVNLGQMSHTEIIHHYQKSSALIFPSFTESFGLPLIEATQLFLPILAPELDYVRDVCSPVQTFDPHSPVSISRAVQRFLETEQPSMKIASPEEFLQFIMAQNDNHPESKFKKTA